MFKSIYVPVDNSEYSNRAYEMAVKIGSAFDSKIVGSHVYAAAMHDYRFKQMEFTLPDEYLQEEEIERQRKIHDSLITMGLELISDCYLNPIAKACDAAGLEFERRMMDGKHHVEIIKDIKENDYELTVLGGLGIGKTRDSQVGSVCDRVVRQANKDVLVVKHLPKDNEPERDAILIGIDGSPQSFGALLTGVELAKKFDKRLEIISVYDPYLHYLVFNSVVDVLTEKAAKVFRFEEQNQLHEEVIDTGLAQIYQSHLNVAEQIANECGDVEVSKVLLDGKAFQKIFSYAEKNPPWLLILGRLGVHQIKEEGTALGSTTENLFRMCSCDILLSTRLEYPSIDKQAEESILWTNEAQERMKRVPDTVRGIARTGILRLAIEQGHSVVTESVIEEAMDRFMPKQTAAATERLAEAIAFEHARNGQVALCKNCGVTAAEADPKQCSVCSCTEFEIMTSELIDEIAKAEGGLEDEVTYDGRKLSWSAEARSQLHAIEDRYQRRRVKARIEKTARVRRLDVVSLEFARAVIEEEIKGELPFDLPDMEEQATSSNGEAADHFEGIKALAAHDGEADKLVVGKDENGVEVRSVYQWKADALERLLRVPVGFMRDKTQERVENIALERKALVITLDIVEAGLEVGKKLMEELVQSFGTSESSGDSVAVAKEPVAEGKCPFSGAISEDSGAVMKDAFEKVKASYETEAKGECPVTSKKKTVSHVYTGAVDDVLNQAGLMHEMHKKRQELKK